jgi:hypothetical protein
MKFFFTALCILFLAVTGVAYHYLYPQLKGPERIGEQLKPLNESFFFAERQSLKVVSAEIISESDKSIVIRYAYLGNDSAQKTTACGSVSFNQYSYSWGCGPVVLNGDRGTIDIFYTLASAAPDIQCSDIILINIYGADGTVFYEHSFSLNKVWHKNSGMMSWYQYRKEGCIIHS